MAPKKLIIVGTGETAEMAYEYFTHDSAYTVVAFAVERQYAKKARFLGLPIVHLEEMQKHYPPTEHHAFVAISFAQLNRLRTRLFNIVKRKHYHLATYVSSKAFVWHNVRIGENCFILENNVLQYRVRIGNNVVLWSGNHIGHQTTIRDNVFITSHVVVSGFCDIGENCFLGVNGCIAHYVKIPRDCVIGMGSVILKDTLERTVYVGNPGKPFAKDSFELFKVPKQNAVSSEAPSRKIAKQAAQSIRA
jgi:sugar O-acyltransferase (sialic acid O-acetyltransferase NeuD family)